MPQPLSIGAHIRVLEVIGKRHLVQHLSGTRASAIAVDRDQTDGVFDSELVVHGEVSEFEQINGVVNDRGLEGLCDRLF
ncbi:MULTISPECIES: hypothetical protein [Leptolyngbya]|jgi:hypothetical protein|uniref:hypothetical protein n=1 Tax=Leptolyngbya TaxID=47251 RepID=UPI00037555E0|nr:MULTISPECIES: hypothetical protein [Leptolyngbya]MBD2371110.1 hypothetical protein [Leptolyngbya sp. FACHB-161]MBD2377578.1 hypothetical protein [Leptolyngbya sp. FACHB-238]MBD2402031.1 hypothetical protein [Leptolyngbya sp. FACHB-239]MBD2408550.1 hypothetical protein [Leptolyngbya sp. FACHB-402]BAS60452.1 hypothetical protein LBWT_Y0400 [Leptolyngbya boryana IAM M-101]